MVLLYFFYLILIVLPWLIDMFDALVICMVHQFGRWNQCIVGVGTGGVFDAGCIDWLCIHYTSQYVDDNCCTDLWLQHLQPQVLIENRAVKILVS